MMPSLKSRCVDGFHHLKGIMEALNRLFQRSLEEDQPIASSISADHLARPARRCGEFTSRSPVGSGYSGGDRPQESATQQADQRPIGGMRTDGFCDG